MFFLRFDDAGYFHSEDDFNVICIYIFGGPLSKVFFSKSENYFSSSFQIVNLMNNYILIYMIMLPYFASRDGKRCTQRTRRVC